MKHKRLFVLAVLMIFISVSVFLIYNNTYTEQINYVALGDSLAKGRNPYGVDDYGYTDYIKDYLKSNNKLKNYNNYAVDGYLISNVIDDIHYNRVLDDEDERIGVKKALRESNVVTISIGANDLLSGMSLFSIPNTFQDQKQAFAQIDKIFCEMEELLKIIKQYAKGTIIVVGYYNPLPYLTKFQNEIDEAISYVDNKYSNLCTSMNIYYVKISDVIASNNDYLPNPLDIHPNKLGYEAISKKVIEEIEDKVLK